MPTTEEVMKMLEHESYTNLAALTGADAEQLRREAAERIMTQQAATDGRSSRGRPSA